MNKVKSVLFVAGVSLALAFTFSCSGDSGGGGTEISSSSTNENGTVKKDHISGFSQKGPFMKGSTAVLYELDDKFVQTGRSFRDIIADDKGSFDIKINVELVSPYAMLEADGYYRNEVTGKPSTGTIKLYAIADIREKSNVNVNILTHLEYYRVQKLVEEGKSLKDAKKQAQEEILSIFGISGEFENSEDMSIFGTTEGDAALLAISVLLQGELSEGKFVERLTDFRLGFRETGIWDSKTAKNTMADWAAEASLGSIRNNILGWNLSSAVPDFEKFVRDYWYANYGLGVCDDSLQNGLKKSNRGVVYICQSNAWAVATEYESDTYQWVCVEGEIKDGQASGKKYICKNNAWKIATIYERDTYQWVCVEGEIKVGQVSGNNKYICKNNAWATATGYEIDTYQWVCVEGEIKDGQASGKKYICKSGAWVIATGYEIDTYQWVCTEGEIKTGQASGKKYICKNSAWAIATEYEIDTYQWVCTEGEIKDGQASGKKYICKNNAWAIATEAEVQVGICSKEGEIKAGQASGKKYVCKYETWRIASYKDIVCFEEKNCNYFTDARDNQRYAYVVIGEQTWMAENLNYNASGSKCHNNEPANCNPYGRLYNWVIAMGIDAKYEEEEWSGSDVKHEGICPTGWHLPSNEEWQELVDFVGTNVGKKLKTTSGWPNKGRESGNGTDDYGFSAWPSGGYYGSGFSGGGSVEWWSSSENGAYDTYSRLMNDLSHLNRYSRDKGSYLFSVRCVQD